MCRFPIFTFCSDGTGSVGFVYPDSEIRKLLQISVFDIHAEYLEVVFVFNNMIFFGLLIAIKSFTLRTDHQNCVLYICCHKKPNRNRFQISLGNYNTNITQSQYFCLKRTLRIGQLFMMLSKSLIPLKFQQITHRGKGNRVRHKQCQS